MASLPHRCCLIDTVQPDLFYTSHYTVDRHCSVPYIFTIHDLNRIRWPQYSYSDAAFIEQFGWNEFATVRRELQELRECGDDGQMAQHGEFTKYFTALTRHLAQRAERIVTVSRASMADISEHILVDSRLVSIVRCGVDSAVFRPRRDIEVGAVRHQFRLDGPYLLYVGLNHPNKRLSWLVRKLLEAREAMPDLARLVVVGGHADQDSALRRMIRRANGDDFVVFTGRVSDDELASLYSGACATVTASLCEGSGLPTQEAAACGCEVITTDIPAFRETVGDIAHMYPSHRGDILSQLAIRALSGKLPKRSAHFTPWSWDESGRALARAVGGVDLARRSLVTAGAQ